MEHKPVHRILKYCFIPGGSDNQFIGILCAWLGKHSIESQQRTHKVIWPAKRAVMIIQIIIGGC